MQIREYKNWIPIKNGIKEHVIVNVKITISARKIMVGICENSKYLKSIANISVIECDEIICYGNCTYNNDNYYSNKCSKKIVIVKKSDIAILCTQLY